MKKIFSLIIVFILLIVGWGSLYILDETEQAIVVQFGKPVGEPDTTAGLHFKVPVLQNVIKFDKRLLEWDGAATEIPTNDNKYIFIDTFARWKISNALQFYKSAKNEMMAQSRLDDIIDGAVRDEISNRVMAEIIRYSDRKIKVEEEETNKEVLADDTQDTKSENYSGARLEIIESILNNVASKLTELNLGIEVLDIQIKRVNYNQQVQSKLFSRMVSKQNQIAEKYRAQGQGKKQEIRGMQTQRKKEILSGAYLKSQKIRGNADAEAVKIYAETYGQSPEFYKFIKTLETYENTLDSSTNLILSTDNEYLKYLGKK
ncbi:MAG: protease modulator HflC [Candidatus Marinimicrobia bacterium]|nr:protease modulator HflC [Candidatus Neomarinimicrobiota bacterium]MBL7023529.1 protease modulator HflC [Candidatus Neomarinimicrobiota bacterium]MBL7109431.1 protease modulator HflC [Candidatus Neomarinimicrobiota bacterium]